MSINIGPPAIEELRPRICVIGVGGAGGNAIANMISAEIEGVDFIVANTDAQALNSSVAEHRIQLGPDITQGLGAGSRPEVGRAAAEETLSEIERALEGKHMCFVAAGMGGGTGTGAAPIIAKLAREKGVLTVGVVTKPFMFEGTRRMRAAEAGIEELQKHVDTLIVIPNQNLFLVAKAETTFKEAFLLADEVLQQGVRSITDLMVMPGLINLDFADIRSVMGEMGKAMMGTGEGQGENRALEAAERAIANPLLDGVSMQGAKGVIISIIGGDDMKLLEVDEAANHIRELVDPNANIIWGSAFNPDLSGKIRVSVVATGIEPSGEQSAEDHSRPLNLGANRGPVRTGLTPPPAQSLFERVDAASAPLPAAEAHPVAEAVAAPDPVAAAHEGQSAHDAWDEQDSDEFGDEFENEPGHGGAGGPGGSTDGHAHGHSRSDHADPAWADEPANDGLLSEASRLVEDDANVTPIPQLRRRKLIPNQDEEGGGHGSGGGGGGSGSGGGSGGGSVVGATLFERMANLSRGTAASRSENEDDDDDDAGSASISIPRFLGRQSNQ